MTLSQTQPKSMSLYYYDACPFCAMTRKAIQKLGVSIEPRNIQQNNQHRSDLIQGGGKKQVPCLRIEHSNGETQWLYESSDIVNFISQ
ncbi:glutaredoxin [uncultured Psychromonas sp.]|uniref:glutaredoxin family protein n=1 Tax=uncultured Psychromonas sp. TaxID=173974 RepID=UPI002624C7F9|nr:glutaredoxin [uncultured Psychromonas sp.]